MKPDRGRRRALAAMAIPFAATLPGCAVVPAVGAAFTQQIDDAIDAKLESAVAAALAILGAPGGFGSDPTVHVPLPPVLRIAIPVLEAAGMGPQLQALEAGINRAEEQAASAALPVYRTVIRAQRWPQDLDRLRALLASPAAALQALAGERLNAAISPLIDDAAHATGVDDLYAAVRASRNATADIRGFGMRDLHAYLVRHFIGAVEEKVDLQANAVRPTPGPL